MALRWSMKAAAALVLAAGCVLSLLANLPGHLSYDSILQLAQGRSGVFNTWHPPVMAWLLGVFDALLPGTGLFVALDTLLLYGALAALLLLPGRARWPAVALAVFWVLSPQGLIYPGIVWKDVLFAAAALAGFAALAHAAVRWERRAPRWLLLAAAVALWTLAALARQNGLIALVFGAVAIGWIAWRHGAPRRLAPAAGLAAAALAAAGLVMALATAAFVAHSDGEPAQRYQLLDLQAYDLAYAARADPAVRLDRLAAADPTLERLIRTDAARAYSRIRIDPLVADEDLQEALHAAPPRLMRAQWLQLMARRPDLYLRARLTAFDSVFLIPDIAECVPVFVGVSGPEDWLARLHIAEREDRTDHALRVYGDSLIHTPVFSHLAFAALALVVLMLLLRRRAPADPAVAALLVSALGFTGSFLVLSIACDYRYLYFLDVSALAAGLYLASTTGRPERQEPARPKSVSPS